MVLALGRETKICKNGEKLFFRDIISILIDIVRMNTPHSAQLFEKIAQIQRMERGKLTVMREGPEGPYYKLQVWENGKNLSRYVSRDQATGVQAALDGYHQFKAQDHLRETGGIDFEARQIQRLVQHVGADAQLWQEREFQPAEAEPCDAPVMYVSADGTGAPMRKSALVGRAGKRDLNRRLLPRDGPRRRCAAGPLGEQEPPGVPEPPAPLGQERPL